MNQEELTTFTVLHTDAPITAERALDASRRAVITSRAPGFVAASLFLADDGRTVVVQAQWAHASSYAAALVDHPGIARWQVAADLPGVHVGTIVAGRAAPGLEGPSDVEGVTIVAIRHLAPGAVASVLELLSRSGEWKRSFPGFVAATPYVSADGTLFVNHVRWQDEDAYRAWMHDPRISEAKDDISAHETAPAEYLRCRLFAHVAPAGRVQAGFVLDLTCVRSYLAFTRFERVLQRSAGVAVSFMPFQVDPDAPAEAEMHQQCVDSGCVAAGAIASMNALGARDGLAFRFDKAIYVNTLRAHRLVAAASAQGRGTEMVERLFRACLTDGLNIGDRQILAALAAEVGVVPPRDGETDLTATLKRIRAEGVHEVPWVIIGEQPPLIGLQSEEIYAEVLGRAAALAVDL